MLYWRALYFYYIRKPLGGEIFSVRQVLNGLRITGMMKLEKRDSF